MNQQLQHSPYLVDAGLTSVGWMATMEMGQAMTEHLMLNSLTSIVSQS